MIFKKNKMWVLAMFLIGLFQHSCKSPYEGLITIEETSTKKSFPSIFQNRAPAFVFSTSIKYKAFDFKGLTTVRKPAEKVYNVVFTTENGAVALDVLVDSTSTKIRESLNLIRRKGIWKVIEKDLRLLFDNVSGIENVESLRAQGSEDPIFRLKNRGDYRSYFYDSAQTLKKIEEGTKHRPKIELSLKDYKDSFPGTITITHQNLDLTILLERIENR